MKSEQHAFSEETRTRATILALHGFTGSPVDFEPLFDRVGVAVRWRFSILPGHVPGGEPGGVSMELAWERFDRSLCESFEETCFGGGPVLILAYSMGARMLLEWLRRRPEIKPDGILLISGTPGIFDQAERDERAQSDEALAQRILADGLESFVSRWMDQPIIRTQNTGDLFAEARKARKLRLDAASLASSLHAFGQGRLEPGWSLIRDLECPVWLVTGEHDPKYRELARRMEGMLAYGRWVDTPDAGHAPHLENPDAFAVHLNAFIEHVITN